MNDKDLSSDKLNVYMENFDNLHIGTVPGVTHKYLAVFLISIINCFQKGHFNSRKIFFSPELETEFQETWELYISKSKPKICAGAAYIQLNDEPFFSLQFLRNISNYDRIWNRQNIYTYIKFALIDVDLCNLLMDGENCSRLTKHLIDRYCLSISEREKKSAVGNYKKSRVDKEVIDNINATAFSESNFRDFMRTIKTTEGNPYPEFVITSYINALNGKYVKSLINSDTENHTIYEVIDAYTLSQLEETIRTDFYKDKIYNTPLAAMRFYIRFVNAIKRVKDKYRIAHHNH